MSHLRKMGPFNNKLLGTLALLLCSAPAFAGGLKNTKGLDILLYIFFGGIIAGICTLISWILLFVSANRKGGTLPVISFTFSLPLFGFAVYCLGTITQLGLISFAILILTWVLIYRSYQPNEKR